MDIQRRGSQHRVARRAAPKTRTVPGLDTGAGRTHLGVRRFTSQATSSSQTTGTSKRLHCTCQTSKLLIFQCVGSRSEPGAGCNSFTLFLQSPEGAEAPSKSSFAACKWLLEHARESCETKRAGTGPRSFAGAFTFFRGRNSSYPTLWESEAVPLRRWLQTPDR